MSTELVQDEDYLSEEDSDFAPGDAPGEESASSDDDEAAVAEDHAPGKRKRRDVGDDGAEVTGFENSGDEAIIEKGEKRQKKLKRKDGRADNTDEEEGGEGGLVKTRRMRAAEKAEKRTGAASGPVTIDVDALWAQMTSEPVVRKAQNEPSTTSQPKQDALRPSTQPAQPNPDRPLDESNLIRIKRTYNFAGKVHTEEKLVARDSAEAKLYLTENPTNPDGDDPSSSSSPTQKRLPRKAFRSAFEPVAAADGLSARTDLNLCLSERLRARELAANQAEARKLNTVEKSRMDWAGFVDREGIKDELELAGKSKHSFAARQEFLARSEAVREEEARRLRMAERV